MLDGRLSGCIGSVVVWTRESGDCVSGVIVSPPLSLGLPLAEQTTNEEKEGGNFRGGGEGRMAIYPVAGREERIIVVTIAGVEREVLRPAERRVHPSSTPHWWRGGKCISRRDSGITFNVLGTLG